MADLNGKDGVTEGVNGTTMNSGDDVTLECELDDDSKVVVPDIAFNGATLSLEDPNQLYNFGAAVPPPGSNSSVQRAQSAPGPRPAATRFRSSSDIPSTSPQRINNYEASKYFANRKNSLETAIEVLIPKYVRKELDGDFISIHALAEIDHWDHERERVVLVCEKSIVIANYDFITLKPLVVSRVLYNVISIVQHGPLEYPKGSFMRPRVSLGTKVLWVTGAPVVPTFSVRWNPFSKQIPYITVTSHKLAQKAEGDVEHFKIENFQQNIEKALHNYITSGGSVEGKKINMSTGTIELSSMLGVTARVFNESCLGYSKERGGVNF